MNRFFKPGIVMMQKLKFIYKFMLISFFLLALLLLALFQFFHSNNASINFNQKEKYGVDYAVYSKALALKTERHRVLFYLEKSGDSTAITEMEKIDAEIDDDFSKLIEYDDNKKHILDNPLTKTYLSAEIQRAYEKWKYIKNSYQSIGNEDAEKYYDVLLNDIFEMHTDISDNSNLTLDPELDSYYCMSLTMFQQLPLSKILSDLDVMENRLVSGDKLSQADKKLISLYSSKIQVANESFRANMETAFEYNDNKKVQHLSTLKGNLDEVTKNLTSLSEVLDGCLLDDTSAENIDKLDELIQKAITANSEFYNGINLQLGNIIIDRTEDYRSRNVEVIIALLIVLPIIAYLYFAFALSIIDAVRKLNKATKKVFDGDLTTVVEISANDEIGEIAQTLNKVIAYFKNVIQQLINSEKMVTLGQLVAGVAHEINTPLGAIQASNANTTVYTEQLLMKMQDLLKVLNADNMELFVAFIKRSLEQNTNVTSREQRSYRRALEAELEEMEIEDASELADTLVDMGIYTDIEPYLPLFRSPDRKLLIEMAYNMSGLQRNSQTITVAVARASKMVFALKNYAHRTEAEDFAQEDITSGMETVLALYYNQLKQNTEVIKNYAEIPKIMCNMDSLNQVWTNLIHNALQAMDYKGTLKIDIFTQGQFVVVKVTDSGKGIPEDIRDRIFEPFFTTKPAGEGTGLGLDIVRSIINKHNGTIEVESVPGNTVFTIKLPVTQ